MGNKRDSDFWKPTPPPYRKFKKNFYSSFALTSQFIYQLGEGSMIREVSQVVLVSQITSPVTKQKIAYIKKCLVEFRSLTGYGRGIAAVQVGILERIAVIYMPLENEKLLTIINPSIHESAKNRLRFPEMCMSGGPVAAQVIRPAWIEFSYFDEDGEKQWWKTKNAGLTDTIYNRVFMHEIDHMNGKMFLDLIQPSQIILESDPDFYPGAAFEKVIE